MKLHFRTPLTSAFQQRTGDLEHATVPLYQPFATYRNPLDVALQCRLSTLFVYAVSIVVIQPSTFSSKAVQTMVERFLPTNQTEQRLDTSWGIFRSCRHLPCTLTVQTCESESGVSSWINKTAHNTSPGPDDYLMPNAKPFERGLTGSHWPLPTHRHYGENASWECPQWHVSTLFIPF
ncbi:hypothetical protein TNCV_2824701 [Trichonephila clavipes]|nr:hypothetical protein TNCV_2824701 [Trichonephila clavipes]